MKVLSAILVPSVLALAISTAKADPSPNPETSGAQTMPSGAEPSSPPPATYDPGTPGVAPGTTTTTTTPNTTDTAGAPGSTTTTTTPGGTTTTTTPDTTDTPTAPAPAAPSSTDDMNAATPPAGTPATPTPAPAGNGATEMAIPPPPNGQTTESVPVAPLPPMPGAPEGVYPTVLVPSHVGIGLLVGGGFEDFVGNGIKNVTGDGGYWTARMVAGTREYVGVEAAYVGDARSISALGLNSNSRLISNGLTGNLRLNIPVVLAGGASLIEPFGFVGVGWSHYQITNNNAALSDFISRDDVLTLPYGGGLEYAYRGFLADARFTYTQTYFNNLTSTVGGNLNNWGVGGQVGFEF